MICIVHHVMDAVTRCCLVLGIDVDIREGFSRPGYGGGAY